MMENTNSTNSRRKALLRAGAVVLAVIVVVAAAFAITGLVGRYRKDYTFDGSVYVERHLDLDLDLYEHTAVLQPDGTYKLVTNTEKAVDGNSYNVLAGVDIPKDPCIYVQSLSTSETYYIYIEVVPENFILDESDETCRTYISSDGTGAVTDASGTPAMSFTLESCWLYVPGVEGLNGGYVYVLAVDGDPLLINDNTEYTDQYTPTDETTTGEPSTATHEYEFVLNIIEGQTVNVSSNYDKLTRGVTFYGYAAVAVESSDAAETFTDAFDLGQEETTN